MAKKRGRPPKPKATLEIFFSQSVSLKKLGQYELALARLIMGSRLSSLAHVVGKYEVMQLLQAKGPRQKRLGRKPTLHMAVLIHDVAFAVADGDRKTAHALIRSLAAGYDDDRQHMGFKRYAQLDLYVRAVLKVLDRPFNMSVRRQAGAALKL